jgi:hypothetical protein
MAAQRDFAPMKPPPNRQILMLAALSGVAGLAACVPPHHGHRHAHAGAPLVVADHLNCPESQGWLKRVSISADGTSCEYRRQDGEQVTLTRLPLVGQGPQAALSPVEASLKSLLPPRQDKTPGPDVRSDDGDKDKDTARIDVPGVHIDAHGDKAEVRVFGVTVDADGDDDKAHVNAGLGSDKAVVSADDNGAEVRATDIDASNANLVLVLASDKPGPTGLRTVGYIARGPVSGPLVVAQFKSAEHHNNLGDDHDVRRLIDLNVTR